MNQRILVWDLPTRIFHWSLALSFAGAFLTADSEYWRGVHVLLGYVMLALLAFRLVWGFVGSRYARFGQFLPRPSAVVGYVRGLVRGRPPHYTGHNPLGAIAIFLLLGLGLATGVSGWMYYQEIGGELLEELHEALANAMLAVVVVHVLGVLFSSLVHRENLVRAMLTGRKRGDSRDAIAGSRLWAGLLLLAALSGCWAWLAGSNPAPQAGPSAEYRIGWEQRADRDGD